MEPPDVQTINQNIRAGCLVWYYDLRIIPGTSHKLRSFWAGPRRVLRLIAPALGEIKPVYYPGEEKLVSLDVLKLYHEKNGIRPDPENIDPDQWLRQRRVDGATRGTSGRDGVEILRTICRVLEIPPELELEI